MQISTKATAQKEMGTRLSTADRGTAQHRELAAGTRNRPEKAAHCPNKMQPLDDRERREIASSFGSFTRFPLQRLRRYSLVNKPQQRSRSAIAPKSLATISQSPVASKSTFCKGPYSVGRATNAVFRPCFCAFFRS